MMYFPSLYLIHKATKIPAEPAELTPNPSSIVGGLGTSIVIGPYSLLAVQSIPSHPSLGHMGSNDSDMFCPVPLGLSIRRLS